MELNERYYARRAVEELRGADRALTPEGKARRLALAEAFQLKCEAERMLSSGRREMNGLAAESSATVSFLGA